MAPWELVKWYFDFVTPEQEYVFAYLGQASLLGVGTGELQACVVRLGDGGPRVADHVLPRSRCGSSDGAVSGPAGTIRFTERGASISLAAGDTRLDLHYTATARGHPRELVIGRSHGGANPDHGPTVRWVPTVPDAVVTGEVRLSGRRISVHSAPGYADRLTSHVLPPLVPVSELFWGRIAGSEHPLCFSVVDGVRPGERWTRLVLLERDRIRELEVTRLAVGAWDGGGPDRHPRGYELEAVGGGVRVLVAVEHLETAIESEFPGPEVTSHVAAPVLRLLTRHPRGAKFFGRAAVTIEHAGTVVHEDAPIIDEHVRFGRAPAPA